MAKKELLMDSQIIETDTLRYLEKCSRRKSVLRSTRLKSLKIDLGRARKWAEKYFGFSFSDGEVNEEKLSTVGDFINSIVHHSEEMKKLR